MRNFTIIISVLFIVFSALPLIETHHWWIRIFDYPRVQIAILGIISMILIIIYLNKGYKKNILIGLVFLFFSHQVYSIIPYTSIYPIKSEKYKGRYNSSSFSILEVNIKMNNKEVDKFIKLVYENKPDILVITEPNKWWENEIKELDVLYPYSIKKPLDNTYGMIVYSKFELRDQEINFLVEDNIPSFYTKVILPNNKEFDLYTLHPEPPKPGSSTYDRDTEILIVGRKIRNIDRPVIVIGDLNDVGWSSTSRLFQKYSGLIDPRIGRGFFNTYNVYLALFRYPLDHFFYSKHFKFVRLKRLNAIGSDHYPVLMEVNLENNRKGEKDLPKLDQEEKEDVNETLNQE